jgi:hypothetical protein
LIRVYQNLASEYIEKSFEYKFLEEIGLKEPFL